MLPAVLWPEVQVAPAGSRRQETAVGGALWSRGGRRWHGALVSEFQLARKTHRRGQRLRVENLDVEAERRLEARREDLDLLLLGEGPGAGQ